MEFNNSIKAYIQCATTARNSAESQEKITGSNDNHRLSSVMHVETNRIRPSVESHKFLFTTAADF